MDNSQLTWGDSIYKGDRERWFRSKQFSRLDLVTIYLFTGGKKKDNSSQVAQASGGDSHLDNSSSRVTSEASLINKAQANSGKTPEPPPSHIISPPATIRQLPRC